MEIGTVAEIHRYPVKSMGGERIDTATITSRGLEGDRTYAIFDPEVRKVGSAKDVKGFPKLLDFSARLSDAKGPVATSPVEVTLPDGRSIRSDDLSFLKILGSWFGREVAFGSVSDDPSRRPIAGRYAMLDTFFDYAPLHILTDVAIAGLAASAPQSLIAAKRFRPNLLIASSAKSGYPENDWVGKRFRIGNEVVLEVTDPCPRCAMVTLAQGDLDNDPGILKQLARSNSTFAPVLESVHPCLGAYAFVKQGGTVRTGDMIRMG